MSRNTLLVAIGVLAVVIVGAISVLVLGGGDDDDGAQAEPDATATLLPGDFGPEPRLGDWVTAIYPVHASAIPQSATRSPNPQDPNGVCIDASFHDLPQNTLWFRMAVDGVEVTDASGAIWIVPTLVDAEGGRFCWAPPEGLEVGIHDAAVTVQDPNNFNAPTRQVVAWKFEVIPG